MQNNEFKKEYICFIKGHLPQKNGYIELPIARKSNSIIERCVNSDGQYAKTYYKVLREYKDYSLICCTLETGRTHQIRVHFSHIGHALLGDTLYGETSSLISRQALHSYKISFYHPITKKELCLTCPLPIDMQKIE